jgi:hypothetical protein
MSDQEAHSAPTLFLLMAQYNGMTVVPLDQVCRDFFSHLTVEKLLRKALRGDIPLPIVRIETSQKAQRGVHLVDLAAYIDKRRAAAIKECRQLTGQQSRKGPRKNTKSVGLLFQPVLSSIATSALTPKAHIHRRFLMSALCRHLPFIAK